jgi:hypothetical protein
MPEVTANPFSTRCVRPGALPFLFRNGESAQALVLRLREQNWWGEIIGPHGSGKSTLVAALVAELHAAGRETRVHAFHDGVVRFTGLSPRAPGLHPAVVLIIDGYEQLSLWQKYRVRRLCRRAGCGLVTTAHHPAGLPELYRTSMAPDVASAVFAELTRDQPALVTASELQKSLAVRKGNLRDALFDLYDLHEHRRRAS